MRHDQLVRVALFLRERRAALDALGGIRNGAVERRPTAAESEGRHHQARVAEYLLRLNQPLAFDPADEPVGVDVDIVEREGRRVAEANAVLVFGLVVAESLARPFQPRTSSDRKACWPGSCRHPAMPPLLIHCFSPLIL